MKKKDKLFIKHGYKTSLIGLTLRNNFTIIDILPYGEVLFSYMNNGFEFSFSKKESYYLISKDLNYIKLIIRKYNIKKILKNV